jgi:superfamily II DNA or RNA helicase
MGIAQRVEREFADGVRARGRSYFAKGRVVVRATGPGEIMAKVRGTTSYRVRLWLRGDRLLATCSCPYFGPEGAGAPCKHIWATVLAVDARQILAPPPGRPIRLMPMTSRRSTPLQPDSLTHREPLAYHRTSGEELGPIDIPRSVTPYDAHLAPRPNHRPQHPRDGSHRPRDLRGIDSAPRPAYPKDLVVGRSSPTSPKRREKRSKPGIHAHQSIGGSSSIHPSNGTNPGLPLPPFSRVRPRSQVPHQPKVKPVPGKRRLYYIIDVPATLAQNQVVIDLARRERKANGERGPLRPWWHTPATAPARVDPEDLNVLHMLETARQLTTTPASEGDSANTSPAPLPTLLTPVRRFVLAPGRQAEVIERLCRTGRCRLRRTDGEDEPPGLRWDDGPPWQFWLDVRCDLTTKRWTWRGALHRRGHRMDLAEPLVILPGLLILGTGRAARFDDAGVPLWVARIRQEKELSFLDASKQDAMLAKILEEAKLNPADLLEDLPMEVVKTVPRPRLIVRSPRRNYGVEADRYLGQLEFEYRGVPVPAQTPGNLYVCTDRKVVIHRDVPIEQAAAIKLFEAGFRETKDHLVEPGTLELGAKKLEAVTKQFVSDGWMVETEGEVIQPATDFKLAVTSGIDWFELTGAVDFGGQSVPLPEVLAAARRGEARIRLGDGSMGMLPEEWLRKYGLLAGLGTEVEGTLRFSQSQASLLDSLLASQPGVRVDAGFSKAREHFREFDGVAPLDAPAGFEGTLRPYQRDGLGWLDYLHRFGFGGILADDMGLGKTIQVLSLLQRRKELKQAEGPALAVVPRSLVFNWIEEAAKFTPKLKILDYTGRGRPEMRKKFKKYDLIISTYGTVRTDIAELDDFEFDYVILDEAQAIKNSSSQAAKAARLLKGRHRLAMSGTPIENHLGELWSIFEFLNPGMLGSAGIFKGLTGTNIGQDLEAREGLAKALKPFILRRTKAQVVQDLPEKTEQTLYCTMEPAQRRIYEELRTHYRNALLRKGTTDLNKSKIEVFEALLRLRQAACHPGLLDKARKDEPSAKLDMLIPQLAEVVEEGHKVLVFSQFTSFLALVKEQLDKEGLVYEYLDGKTRNRAERVERFQTDPDCPIFLISLKAGGLGLNLTAAEYVYLLDPWWNPAVEAQAIDRSHRIGQVNNVFAYRLICRDTVEQKIVDLQQQKRDLADAILNVDNKTILKSLSREDLEYLLS